VLALCVDGLGDSEPLDRIKTLKLLHNLGFKFPAGAANAELVEALDSLQRSVIYRQPQLPLPSSFLIDPAGRMVAVYKGPVSVDQLLADIRSIRELDPARVRDLAIPFTGRWIDEHMVSNPLVVASVYLQDGGASEARAYIEEFLEREAKLPASEPPAARRAREQRLADLQATLAEALNRQGKSTDAVAAADNAIALNPKLAEAHFQRAAGLIQLDKPREAAQALTVAARLAADDPRIGAIEGRIFENRGEVREAIAAYRRSVAARLDTHTTPVVTPSEPAWMHAIQAVRWEEAVRFSAQRLAWLLATSPTDDLRNGREALQFAQRACELSVYSNPAELDGLAAALAETQDFAKAAKVARQAIFWAQSHGDDQLAKAIAARANLYEAQKPFRSR
jgi:tetratricopeptide (TPR) repeat protein